MHISEAKIVAVPLFLAEIMSYPNACWIYRGQADSSWPLLPKAGRPDYYLPEDPKTNNKDLPPRDICRFNEWRRLAVAYSKTLPANDFECLAFAQHYGLATRLLDWSTNPLVALFFAVDSCSPSDGVVYCHVLDRHIDTEAGQLGKVPVVAQYTPPPFDRRILSQCGVFTYHPFPNQPLTAGPITDLLIEPLRPKHGRNLVRITIEPKLKPILKRQLDEIDVNRRSLFPDLEGLSDFVNWETRMAANSV